jgi:uncharacterized protein (DUF2235 family)
MGNNHNNHRNHHQPRPSITLERPAPPEKLTKPLILLCDGTWCDRETNTRTNIRKLAEMVGVVLRDNTAVELDSDRFCYLEGVGVGSSFLEYVSL